MATGVVSNISAHPHKSYCTNKQTDILQNVRYLSFFLDKYLKDCLPTMVFQYNVRTCQRTCQSLSFPDISCTVDFTPIDGCICKEGFYLTQYGECVPQSECHCYHMGIYYTPGEKVNRNGLYWYVFLHSQ